MKDTGQTPADALSSLQPELVMAGGRIMLTSERFALQRFASQASKFHRPGFHRLQMEGRGMYLVRADIPRLCASASAALGSEIRLGGKRVLA